MSDNLPINRPNVNRSNLPSKDSKPWLIAAWPGMGNVGVIAAGTLIQERGLLPVTEVAAEGVFDDHSVGVKAGLGVPSRAPRSVFYSKPAEGESHPIIVFASESQPSHGHAAFADAIMEHAIALGVERVITLASMPAQIHPSVTSKVYGAATSKETLDELDNLEVVPLQDGQIGGQAGVLLAAAARRGIPGLCLMGEIPFFAPGVPNPGAARSVLGVFDALHHSDTNVAKLSHDAEKVERLLIDMLGKMHASTSEFPNENEREVFDETGGEIDGDDSGDEQTGHPIFDARPAAPKGGSKNKNPLDASTEAQIEAMFAQAEMDRSLASPLKAKLDSLNAFKFYENRFLDLFRRA